MSAFSLSKGGTVRNAHFWSAFCSGEGHGSWEMASSKLWLTDVQSRGRALVQMHVVNSAAPDISSFNASLAFLPLLSFSPPSAPSVSCTLGVVLGTNMFAWHWELSKRPKTSVCGVSAPLTSAEIWHGISAPLHCHKINTSTFLHVEAQMRT